MNINDYGIGNLIHDGELYDYLNNFLDDFEFYKKWCLKINAPVLELCSGTGRLTIPLKESGIDIKGLDISDSMLKKAREKASKKRLNIEFLKGDIRTFELSEEFSLIFIPFNSLQCIYTIKDVESVFNQVKKHLNSNGIFIFDIFNPSIHLMVEREGEFHERTRYMRDDGIEVVISEKCHYDSAGQVNRVEWLHKIGEDEYLEKLDVRCFYPLEMDALLQYNSFNVIHKFGSFGETPFNSESQKLIYVCEIL